jgi:hypothetical protein
LQDTILVRQRGGTVCEQGQPRYPMICWRTIIDCLARYSRIALPLRSWLRRSAMERLRGSGRIHRIERRVLGFIDSGLCEINGVKCVRKGYIRVRVRDVGV